MLAQAHELDTSELELLISSLQELRHLKKSDQSMYTFSFEAKSNPRFAIPYVATITLDNNTIERDFHQLDKTYTKTSVFVEGEFSAFEGEIIELCKGGKATKKFQNLYVIYMGRLTYLGKTDDARLLHKVRSYLAFEIDLHTLRSTLL